MIRSSDRKTHRIRLAGIDAPEKGQAFSSRSRQHLAQWIQRQEVIVDWHKRDDYGRLTGVVIAFGHDINLEQVRAGMAWWYRAYAHEQRPADARLYAAAEQEARIAKRGLWSSHEPMPPWEWRRKEQLRLPSSGRSNRDLAPMCSAAAVVPVLSHVLARCSPCIRTTIESPRERLIREIFHIFHGASRVAGDADVAEGRVPAASVGTVSSSQPARVPV